MRNVCALAFLAAFMLAPSQGYAREYPWCATYYWEGDNCGFDTAAQCWAAVSGAGGFCYINPRYVAPPPRQPRRR